MKRTISLLLSLVMVLALLPFSAISVGAEINEFVNEGVKYVLSQDGTYYTVAGFDESVTETTIISEYNGIPVTHIADYMFSNCSMLEKLKILATFESVGWMAFVNCTALTSLEFGDSVRSIEGLSEFSDNDAITSITVSSGNQYYYSSNNCVIEKATNTLVLGCKSSIIPKTVTRIGDLAFQGCSKLTSISIPNSVISIGSGAFMYCENLMYITIPDSVVSIGRLDFTGCDRLQYNEYGGCLYLGNSNNPYHVAMALAETDSSTTNLYMKFHDKTKIIARDAFCYKSKITSVSFSNSVTHIGDGAFDSCGNLMYITIPDSVISIGNSAFSSCSLREVTIPASVTSVGVNPFAKTPITKMLVHTENTTYHVKNNCLIETKSKKLVSACVNGVIPDDGSVITIGSAAFFGRSCSELSIPKSISTIEDRAFAKSEGFASVTIPNSVTTMGEFIFEDCYYLNYVYCESESTPFGWDTLWNRECSAKVYWGATSYIDTAVYTLSADGKYYIVTQFDTTAVDVVIPSQYKGLPVTTIGDSAFEYCSSLTSIEIPNSVTTIGDSAFYECSSLTSIEIPNSVTTIGDSAFYECSSLTSIEIPNSVTTIGTNAFYCCSRLTSIEIPDSVTTIGARAFSYCDSLTSVEIPENAVLGRDVIDGCSKLPYTEYENIKYYGSESNPYQIAYEPTFSSLSSYTLHPQTKQLAGGLFASYSKLTSIEIPNSVTTIGYSAFEECTSLTSIEIPNSVTTIGDYAFYKCSSLTSIEIPNSVTTIGNEAFYKCSSLTSIEIPASVTELGDRAFYNCTYLTDIYCEAESQPEGWSLNWKDVCYAIVHWGVHLCNGEGGWISDGTSHWKLCACGEKADVEAHIPGAEADCENDQICTVCEYILVEAYGHKAESDTWYSDSTKHWQLCSCGEKVDVAEHIPGAEADCENDQICTVCEYVLVEAYGHKAESDKLYSDANNHWKLCSCGEKVDVAEHTPGAEADCENDQICTICEHILVEAYGHKAEGEWKYDEDIHWKSCSCGEDVDVDSHDFEWIITSEPEVGVPGEQEYTCKTCGYVSETEEIPALEPEILLGDVNGNGTLDTMDYSLLKRVYFGIYNTPNVAAGDINGNGGLDTMDYSLLKRVYFGIYII